MEDNAKQDDYEAGIIAGVGAIICTGAAVIFVVNPADYWSPDKIFYLRGAMAAGAAVFVWGGLSSFLIRFTALLKDNREKRHELLTVPEK